MGAQMADLRSPPQSRSGLSLFFGLFLVCLPFRDREEDSTARWVGLESPSRPAVALSFVCGDVGGDQSPKVLLAHTPFRRFLSQCMLMAITGGDFPFRSQPGVLWVPKGTPLVTHSLIPTFSSMK